MNELLINDPDLQFELMQLLTLRISHGIKSPDPYEHRVNGAWADSMLYWLLTGERHHLEPTFKVSEYDLIPVMNLYLIASEDMRAIMDPFIVELKTKAFAHSQVPNGVLDKVSV
jgi:hypothetical protein